MIDLILWGTLLARGLMMVCKGVAVTSKHGVVDAMLRCFLLIVVSDIELYTWSTVGTKALRHLEDEKRNVSLPRD